MLDGSLWFSDGWTLVEDQLRSGERATGALFTTSSGLIGVPGRRREPFGPGTGVLLRGCYETRPYAHPERSFGVPERYQTIVPATDPTGVAVRVGGVDLTPVSGTWSEHLRTLDLRTGCVATAGLWRGPSGATVAVRSRRMASLEEPGVLWTALEVEPLDGPAVVEVVATVRASTGHRTFPDEPEALTRAWGRVFRPVGTLEEDDVVGLVHAAALSGRTVACASSTASRAELLDVEVGADAACRRFRAAASPGSPLVLAQRAAFAVGDVADATELLRSAAAVAAARHDIDGALDGQRSAFDRLWAAAAVDLEGAEDVERAVRFSTFHVLQASVGNPGLASPAKGLTGQGYEGHHLWDQEVYVGHVLTLLAPEAAHAALSFRCRTLPAARARAAELSHRGAQFPWRTIDGTEASAFFPAGAAQHHVNADIAWALDHHVDCSGDDRLLTEGHGLELLAETARFWMSIGRFDEEGRFRIEGVTGPDEYTALVDDNLYTNLMAARNLRSAADRLEALAAADPDAHDALARAIDLAHDELVHWRRAAAAVVVPYDDVLMVHGQDATFLQRPRWDLAATPPDRLPLQDHHHLLTLYRHQVLKQADVVLALFLLRDLFTPEERRRDFDHYEPLTTHDSSLSAPIHAIVAADVGRLDLAWRYTCDTALRDLDDRAGTLGDGLHLAAAAGAWLAVARGFGGFAVRGGMPCFRPQLPPGVRRVAFRLRFHGCLLEVGTDTHGTAYRLLEGGPLTVLHGDDKLEVPASGAAQAPPA